MKMTTVDWVSWALVVIGALNWGILAVTGLNFVETIFGAGSITQVVYILVGVSGVYMLWSALSKKK